MVSHDVGMPASFQHENLLLKGGDVIVCEWDRRKKVAAGGGLQKCFPSQEV